jgi:uncharacterized protein (DUF1810 family)
MYQSTGIEERFNRFVTAQHQDYPSALSEIKSGRKRSHWMWYIFPQLDGLGVTETSRYYALQNIDDAAQYLAHPVLGKRLIEISTQLLALEGKSANAVFGNPDDLKLKSCMTLFALVPDTDEVFEKVLDKYYNGTKDSKTLLLLKQKI